MQLSKSGFEPNIAICFIGKLWGTSGVCVHLNFWTTPTGHLWQVYQEASEFEPNNIDKHCLDKKWQNQWWIYKIQGNPGVSVRVAQIGVIWQCTMGELNLSCMGLFFWCPISEPYFEIMGILGRFPCHVHTKHEQLSSS